MLHYLWCVWAPLHWLGVSAIRSSYNPLLLVTTETSKLSYAAKCNTLTRLAVWVQVLRLECEYKHIARPWPWYKCRRHCNMPHFALKKIAILYFIYFISAPCTVSSLPLLHVSIWNRFVECTMSSTCIPVGKYPSSCRPDVKLLQLHSNRKPYLTAACFIYDLPWKAQWLCLTHYHSHLVYTRMNTPLN